MESHVAYLRVRLLWDHLHKITNNRNGEFEDVSKGLTFASVMSLLEPPDEVVSEHLPKRSLGGITSKDLALYGPRGGKLGKKALLALSESLDQTLKDVTLYFHAADAQELSQERLHSLTLSLCDDVRNEVVGKRALFEELLSQLKTMLDLYEETSELHPRLYDNLHEVAETIPAVINANHKASLDLLATTAETLLLKLSVIRARLHVSLYDYTTPSIPGVTISTAVNHMHQKLVAHHQGLDEQERDLQLRLREYEELLELVDGKRGGFAQVVEDLATVNRETEECRRDLQRLGWTET